MKNNINGANKIFGQLTANKKKTSIALCLIALMVFMWVRVFAKKTPKAAAAAIQMQTTSLPKVVSDLKISFVDLPVIAGRNDVINRDFFVLHPSSFVLRATKQTGTVEVGLSNDGSEELTRRLAEKLKLEAIAFGQNPQAFINGKSLSIGEKLLISDANEKYECEVIGIGQDTVFVRCQQTEITLKLKKLIEVCQ